MTDDTSVDWDATDAPEPDVVEDQEGDAASDHEDRIVKLERQVKTLKGKASRDVSDRLDRLEYLVGVGKTEEGVPVGVDVTVPEA